MSGRARQTEFGLRRPLCSHRNGDATVCDFCPHAEPWSPAGFDAMREHIKPHIQQLVQQGREAAR